MKPLIYRKNRLPGRKVNIVFPFSQCFPIFVVVVVVVAMRMKICIISETEGEHIVR